MAGGTAITDKFDKLVFQTPWSNKIVVPFVLNRMKALGLTKVGLITDSGGYGKDGLAVIKAEAPKAGIEIVSEQTFNAGDADVSAQLTKIRGANPQAVLMWTAGKDAANILKTARDLGIEQPFFGGSGQARAEFPTGAGEAAEGFEFGTGKFLLPESWGKDTEEYKVASDFVQRFEAKYGEKPDIFAGHAYDALAIFAAALKATEGDTDPAKLRDAIEKTTGLVGMGGKFSFTPNDHNGLTTDDLFMYKIQGGTWVPAE
jgi:branched-chain amino acid transport system substrate-binding protein